MSRREYYSTALTQAQGITSECISLFDLWQEGMSAHQLFEVVQASNALGMDSERRLRNIVIEGFGSRFLREPYTQAAPSLKFILSHSRDHALLKQLILLYALRQHGIFFDFLTEEYWPAVRANRKTVRRSDISLLIDSGTVSGRLGKNWAESVKLRVSSYVMGIAEDFGFLGKSRSGERPILLWSPHDFLILYLAYDLHFLGASDDEVANAPEWQALGLLREDVTLYLHRLQSQGHLIAQDTGHLCRIDWKYQTREELSHVLIS